MLVKKSSWYSAKEVQKEVQQLKKSSWYSIIPKGIRPIWNMGISEPGRFSDKQKANLYNKFAFPWTWSNLMADNDREMKSAGLESMSWFFTSSIKQKLAMPVMLSISIRRINFSTIWVKLETPSRPVNTAFFKSEGMSGKWTVGLSWQDVPHWFSLGVSGWLSLCVSGSFALDLGLLKVSSSRQLLSVRWYASSAVSRVGNFFLKLVHTRPRTLLSEI